MEKLRKIGTSAAVGLILLLVAGCASEPGLDKMIITTSDGRTFELQHRILDTYVIHRVGVDKKALTAAVIPGQTAIKIAAPRPNSTLRDVHVIFEYDGPVPEDCAMSVNFK